MLSLLIVPIMAVLNRYRGGGVVDVAPPLIRRLHVSGLLLIGVGFAYGLVWYDAVMLGALYILWGTPAWTHWHGLDDGTDDYEGRTKDPISWQIMQLIKKVWKNERWDDPVGNFFRMWIWSLPFGGWFYGWTGIAYTMLLAVFTSTIYMWFRLMFIDGKIQRWRVGAEYLTGAGWGVLMLGIV